MPDKAKVVIVGGGFGGLQAARALKGVDVDVTLVDKSNHHLFQPLLYQVATAALSPADIAMPIRHILRRQSNVQVLLGEVSSVDTAAKRVVLAEGPVLNYDFLILSAGATHSYFGNDDWEAHARGLKSIEDATFLRAEILAAFEYAERIENEAERQKWMSIVIVGGGPTGVELAGAIAEVSRHAIKSDFRRIRTESAKISLLEGSPRLLASYPHDLSARTQRDLQRLGVEVHLSTVVQGVDDEGVETSRGRIDARTVIWAAGVRAAPVAKWVGCDADASGRARVNPDFSVPGLPGIFVIGDGAALSDEHGHQLPGVAQVAIQGGSYVGKVIKRQIQGKAALPPFRYRNLGNLATIGRSSAIADFRWIRLKGRLAWWVWLFVHIMNLVGFRNRLSVLLQWAWAYFTWDRGARLITASEFARHRPKVSDSRRNSTIEPDDSLAIAVSKADPL